MKSVWLIRHGQSRSQTGEESWEDPALSERGQRQADRLRDLLAGERFDHVRLSPLRRARDTYLRSGVRCGDVAFDSRICEVTFGSSYEGILPYRTPDWAAADLQDAWLEPGPARARSFLRELAVLAGERVLVIGHWGIFSLLALLALGVPDPAEPIGGHTPSTLYLQNCALGELVLDHPRFGNAVLRWNERRHLHGLPA